MEGGCLTQEGGGANWRDADACRDGRERQNPAIKSRLLLSEFA